MKEDSVMSVSLPASSRRRHELGAVEDNTDIGGGEPVREESDLKAVKGSGESREGSGNVVESQGKAVESQGMAVERQWKVKERQ